MSDELHERIDRLLDDAATQVDSQSAPDEDESSAERVEGDGLTELAGEARAVLETTDSQELLDALELGDSAEGSTSVPVAIATGDPERVQDFRALLKLSKLPAEGEDAAFDEDERQQALESLGGVLGDRAGSDGEPEDTDVEERPDTPDEAETETDESDGDTAGKAVRSAMQSALDGIRDELEGIGEDDTEPAAETDDTADEDRGDADDEDGDDDADEGDGDADEDDGLLGGDGELLGDTDSGSTGSSDRLSTVPGQDRADMRAVARYSTMPDR